MKDNQAKLDDTVYRWLLDYGMDYLITAAFEGMSEDNSLSEFDRKDLDVYSQERSFYTAMRKVVN